jgi:single-strand DNA-binding protein
MQNRYSVTGYLGDDPKFNTTSTGKVVCKFQIASNRKWTNNEGDVVEATDWHNIEVWGKGLVGLMRKHGYKGQKVSVEGRHQTDKYTKEVGGESVVMYFAKMVCSFIDLHTWKTSRSESTDEGPQPQPELPLEDAEDIPF